MDICTQNINYNSRMWWPQLIRATRALQQRYLMKMLVYPIIYHKCIVCRAPHTHSLIKHFKAKIKDCFQMNCGGGVFIVGSKDICRLHA